jgi:hypothetical protein
MTIQLTQQRIDKLLSLGVSTLLRFGIALPDEGIARRLGNPLDFKPRGGMQ